MSSWEVTDNYYHRCYLFIHCCWQKMQQIFCSTSNSISIHIQYAYCEKKNWHTCVPHFSYLKKSKFWLVLACELSRWFFTFGGEWFLRRNFCCVQRNSLAACTQMHIRNLHAKLSQGFDRVTCTESKAKRKEASNWKRERSWLE